ncbi:MAG TPA: hypothetical protein VGH36_13990 [Acetobacteraceae bacterium]|jgi:hypothetical protein
MKMTIIALATALSMGAAIPAFADQGPPVESPNSLPPGFYNGAPVQARLGQPQSQIDAIQSSSDSSVASGYYKDHAGQAPDGLPHATENMGLSG